MTKKKRSNKLLGGLLTGQNTRDAVETAIGLAKESKDTTWESQSQKIAGRIARWIDEKSELTTTP